MKPQLLIIAIWLCSQYTWADDTETNNVARLIKAKTLKVLSKQNVSAKGFCDVFVDMNHIDNQYAKVVQVSTLGDAQLCKRVKQAIKVGKKYKYQIPERFIRIQIDAREL
ncbi:hypothetical protein O8413_03560 [Vibrio furnissii]|uniref:hypothetical protein n=1 Tax=Vibrio furnissii TaxID=29494 RepID=UPI0024B8D3B2|nr:hypothetical protein [Vibrio furnissii]WHR51993.1 hypothetical protein O8413_03560 [Vibrio furnissii]